MITFSDMITKLGKDKAQQMAVRCPKNYETGADKDRGIRGRVRFRMCECGAKTIEEYEEFPERCTCKKYAQTKAPDFKPTFNIGLGCWVESRSEEKRIAKQMGLREA